VHGFLFDVKDKMMINDDFIGWTIVNCGGPCRCKHAVREWRGTLTDHAIELSAPEFDRGVPKNLQNHCRAHEPATVVSLQTGQSVEYGLICHGDLRRPDSHGRRGW
jgi:hypothetical protein